jgi:hypothetical protein
MIFRLFLFKCIWSTKFEDEGDEMRRHDVVFHS